MELLSLLNIKIVNKLRAQTCCFSSCLSLFSIFPRLANASSVFDSPSPRASYLIARDALAASILEI